MAWLNRESGARAATPAAYRPRPITRADADLLVLDTKPVLAEIAQGHAVVIGSSENQLKAHPIIPDIYTIPASSPSGHLLGTYTVNARTAQVFGPDGKEIQNPELQTAQRIVRQGSRSPPPNCRAGNRRRRKGPPSNWFNDPTVPVRPPRHGSGFAVMGNVTVSVCPAALAVTLHCQLPAMVKLPVPV